MTQVQLPRIRRKVLGDQLLQRLLALPGNPTVAVYRGEVSKTGARPQLPVDTRSHPPLMPDVPDVIAPYVVLFDGTGATGLEPGLGYCGEDLRWSPQVTVAAGFAEDCLQTVDRVCAWLYRWQPVISGVGVGVLEPPPGFDPGPPRPDRTVTPSRFFVPLQWQLDATT